MQLGGASRPGDPRTADLPTACPLYVAMMQAVQNEIRRALEVELLPEILRLLSAS